MRWQEKINWGAISEAIRHRAGTPTELQEAQITSDASIDRLNRMYSEDVQALNKLLIPDLLLATVEQLKQQGFTDALPEGPLPTESDGGRFSSFTFARLTWDVRPSDRNSETLLFDQARFLVARRVLGSTRELGSIIGVQFELPRVVNYRNHTSVHPLAQPVLLREQTPEAAAEALAEMIKTPMTYIADKPHPLASLVRLFCSQPSPRRPIQIYDRENYQSPIPFHPVKRDRFWLP